jgi:hypothetical protein
MKTKIVKFSKIFFFSLLIIYGCAKEKTNDSLSTFKPEITNQADNFQLQATSVVNTTTSISYTWRNNGLKANIDKSGIISSGSGKLTIYDSNGLQVYTTDLKTTGSDISSSGISGDWKIQLDLINYNGTLNFRVQKGG